jgi:hypothetical protein
MWTVAGTILFLSAALIYWVGVSEDLLATLVLPPLVLMFITALVAAFRSRVVITDQVEFRGVLKSVIVRAEEEITFGLVMTSWWSEPVLACTRGGKHFVLPVVPSVLFDEFYESACIAFQRPIPLVSQLRRARWRWGWSVSELN